MRLYPMRVHLAYAASILETLHAVVAYDHCSSPYHRRAEKQLPLSEPALTINGISYDTRAYWMRQANDALGTPCPFAAFGTVIVNHTDSSERGSLVCTGANGNSETGNPTLHGILLAVLCASQATVCADVPIGEMAAITNCSTIMTDPAGPYKLSPAAALAAFADLTLYTNAESCPMCASAIRWAGFREYVYGTSIDTLVEKGWGQIRISSMEVFSQSFDLPYQSRLIGNVLTNETDPYFMWQFDSSYPCPEGCGRIKGSCVAST